MAVAKSGKRSVPPTSRDSYAAGGAATGVAPWAAFARARTHSSRRRAESGFSMRTRPDQRSLSPPFPNSRTSTSRRADSGTSSPSTPGRFGSSARTRPGESGSATRRAGPAAPGTPARAAAPGARGRRRARAPRGEPGRRRAERGIGYRLATSLRRSSKGNRVDLDRVDLLPLRAKAVQGRDEPRVARHRRRDLALELRAEIEEDPRKTRLERRRLPVHVVRIGEERARRPRRGARRGRPRPRAPSRAAARPAAPSRGRSGSRASVKRLYAIAVMALSERFFPPTTYVVSESKRCAMSFRLPGRLKRRTPRRAQALCALIQ